MPQVVDLPALTPTATIALVRVCKETQAKEPFRELRSRLRGAKLWDRDRPAVILRFLGTGGATITPSVFMQAVAAATDDNAVAEAILDRIWQLNPLLAKTVVDLVTSRPYHKDEIAKHLVTGAYKGIAPSRPAFEIWLQNAITHGLLRTVGIAVHGGPRIERYQPLAAVLDVEEFLAEDKPEPEPVIPAHGETEDGTPTADAGGDSSIPNTAAAAPTGSPLPAPLRRTRHSHDSLRAGVLRRDPRRDTLAHRIVVDRDQQAVALVPTERLRHRRGSVGRRRGRDRLSHRGRRRARVPPRSRSQRRPRRVFRARQSRHPR
jgi:hypothetical protein